MGLSGPLIKSDPRASSVQRVYQVVACVASGATEADPSSTERPKRGARGSAATAHWIFGLCGLLARRRWKKFLRKLRRRHGEIRRGWGVDSLLITTVVFCGC